MTNSNSVITWNPFFEWYVHISITETVQNEYSNHLEDETEYNGHDEIAQRCVHEICMGRNIMIII